MKKRSWRIVILLAGCAVLFFPTFLAAQIDFRPGYIIKNGNDTIKGFVSYRMDKLNFESCLFKKEKRDKPQQLTAADIVGFGFKQGKTLELMTLPKGVPNPPEGKVFVKTLVKGAFTLYQYKNYFFLRTPDSLFLLPYPKETVVDRQYYNQFPSATGFPAATTLTRTFVKVNRKYVGILNYLMLDCKIDPSKAKYTEDDLTKVVYKYNLCKATVPTTKNVTPMGRINFQLVSGYVSSNLVYDYQNKKIPFSNSHTILGGAGIEVSSPRVFDKLFFTVEGWMVKALYQGYYEGKVTGDPIKQDISIDISYFKLPFGLKYNFKGVGSTPYVRLGVQWSYIRSSSTKTIQEKEVQGTIYTDQIMNEYQIKNPKGIWLSLGYTKKLYKGTSMFGEVRFERSEGYIGSPVVNLSRLTNVNFLVGLRF